MWHKNAQTISQRKGGTASSSAADWIKIQPPYEIAMKLS